MANTFRYGIDHLTSSKTIELANGSLKGILDKEAIKKIETSKHYVEQIVESNKTVMESIRLWHLSQYKDLRRRYRNTST